ncbi:pyridoxamine 5'-phosphate oxidase family protein [Aquimarina sp. MMG016]|uniref:pyridoxamine 5'-phosphate oxidase family protein n=1 Tax=Aquimarina sp. MMG016 TaxID=2822690 RepID=UPI001B39D36A|nr:pyridoxamine 5'-phosphate oxidase family protein [Aquimarina sp. MMG016]MBQ4820523.1 pyridoxamine 5'-phosphate oxidase family protein [Aquimarina sp. MMG016]
MKSNIRNTIEEIQNAILITKLGYSPPHTSLLQTKEFDNNGNIWFLSDKYSVCNQNLLISNEAVLIYSKPESSYFLSLYGKSEIVEDQERLKELYNEEDIVYAKKRKKDTLTAIKFEILKADYWDDLNRESNNIFTKDYL